MVQDDMSGQDATLLLGLAGLAVEQVELDGEGARVVHVVTDDEAAAGCQAGRSRGVICSIMVKSGSSSRPACAERFKNGSAPAPGSWPAAVPRRPRAGC